MLGYGNFRELDIESRLARALEAIVSKTKSNSSRRINAVRWFNRLYYDLAKWQRRLIDLLNTFPGFRNDALEEDYRDFRERLRKFANDLTIYAGPSDFCARLDFLSARLVKDFDWLHDENPQAYDELEALIGIATFSPHRFHDLTASIYSRFQHVVSDTLGEKYRTDKIPSLGDDSSEDATRLSNSRSAQEMRAAIETYSVESWKAIEGIRTAAQRIGVSLLSVDEYDQAINTEGSSNPNIVVLGETVTMSRDTYNVGQAAAVGPHAQARHVSMNQFGAQFENSFDLDRLSEELSKLRGEMKNEATSSEHDIAVSDVARAEQAAKANDPRKVLEYLKSAGHWAFEVASKIGTTLAAEALKHATGLK